MPTTLRLTKATVAALMPPAAGRLEYHDATTGGLVLRVTANGVKSWCLRKRTRDGRLLRLTLGRFPEMLPEAARQAALAELGSIAAGHDPAAERRNLRAETTLAELFALYLEQHARPRKRTAGEDEARWRLHLAHWGSRRLSGVSAAEVGTWHHGVTKRSGPYAANRAHALLRKLFNFAAARGYDGRNPAQRIAQAPEASRERFLSETEMPRFMAALATMRETEPTFHDFIALAMMTAQRRGVLQAMRWESLDLTRGEWRLSASETKNKRPLVVPLIPPAVHLLRARRDAVPSGCPWVLPSEKKPTVAYAEPKKGWRSLLARAELLGLADLLAERQDKPANAVRAAALDDFRANLCAAYARRLPRGTDALAATVGAWREQVRQAGADPAAASLGDLRIHDLRRSAASRMARAGVPLFTIAKALGHEGTGATPIYARLDVDAQRAALAQAFGAMALPEPVAALTEGQP